MDCAIVTEELAYGCTGIQTAAEANGLAKQIGDLMKSGKKEEAEILKAKTADLKTKEKDLA